MPFQTGFKNPCHKLASRHILCSQPLERVWFFFEPHWKEHKYNQQAVTPTLFIPRFNRNWGFVPCKHLASILNQLISARSIHQYPTMAKVSPASANSKMADHALIIGQIPTVMSTFLKAYKGSTPIPLIRILGDTPNSILDHTDFLKSINMIIEEVKSAIVSCRPDSESRWIATTKFPGHHSCFVLDLNNVSYDYESADKCLTKIPIYVLRLSRRPKIFRHEPQDQRLAEKLAEMHNLHGKDPLLYSTITRDLAYIPRPVTSGRDICIARFL